MAMASLLGKPLVNVYGDINLNFLPLNCAYVVLNTTLDRLGVYSVKDDCYKCPYEREHEFNSYNMYNDNFMVDTSEPYTWRILNNDMKQFLQPDYRSGLICELRPSLGGYGVYRLNVGLCELEELVPPPNPYWPLMLFSAILLGSIITYGLIRLFLRKRNNEAKHNESLNLTARRDNLDIMPSLHFLRGILLILIIFATTGGGGYPIFLRTFGGLTVSECFFFAFTLTFGLAVPVMIDEETKKKLTKRTVFGTIFVKSFFLCVLGLLISGIAPRSRFVAPPLFAPLPRIGMAYLVAATAYLFARDRNPNAKTLLSKACSNVKTLFWSWMLAGSLLALMIISIVIFYSTECTPYGRELLLPEIMNWAPQAGRLKCDYDMFSDVFNKNLLNVNSDEPFHVDYYKYFAQGLMGVVSSILAALIGLNAGVIYVQESTDRSRLWHFWASLLCFAGITVAVMSKAISFNLWPIAVILILASVTIVFYSFIYYITEVRELTSTTISLVGKAATATLAANLLFTHSFPFYWGQALTNHFFYLCQSSWIVLLWVVITVSWMKWRTFLITRVVSDEGTRRAVLSW